MRVAAGVAIGERGNGKGAGVGAHVPAVGDERHGAVDGAADNLDRHHRRRQTDDEPCAPLVSLVAHAKKHMFVAPCIQTLCVHH
jgi:hypothetical protein